MMRIDGRRASNALPEQQLVLFGVGNVVYGFPIERVREVVNPQTIVELPHAAKAVIGVADHRGDVVPVIDLRIRFGLPALTDPEARRRTKWIMVDVGADASRLVAAVVDVVHNVFITREALRPAPPLGGGEDARGIAGVVARAPNLPERGLVFVLDLAPLRVLADDRSKGSNDGRRGA